MRRRGVATAFSKAGWCLDTPQKVIPQSELTYPSYRVETGGGSELVSKKGGIPSWAVRVAHKKQPLGYRKSGGCFCGQLPGGEENRSSQDFEVTEVEEVTYVVDKKSLRLYPN